MIGAFNARPNVSIQKHCAETIQGGTSLFCREIILHKMELTKQSFIARSRSPSPRAFVTPARSREKEHIVADILSSAITSTTNSSIATTSSKKSERRQLFPSLGVSPMKKLDGERTHILHIPDNALVEVLHHLTETDATNFTLSCKSAHTLRQHPAFFKNFTFCWPLRTADSCPPPEVTLLDYMSALESASSDSCNNNSAIVAKLRCNIERFFIECDPDWYDRDPSTMSTLVTSMVVTVDSLRSELDRPAHDRETLVTLRNCYIQCLILFGTIIVGIYECIAVDTFGCRRALQMYDDTAAVQAFVDWIVNFETAFHDVLPRVKGSSSELSSPSGLVDELGVLVSSACEWCFHNGWNEDDRTPAESLRFGPIIDSVVAALFFGASNCCSKARSVRRAVHVSPPLVMPDYTQLIPALSIDTSEVIILSNRALDVSGQVAIDFPTDGARLPITPEKGDGSSGGSSGCSTTHTQSPESEGSSSSPSDLPVLPSSAFRAPGDAHATELVRARWLISPFRFAEKSRNIAGIFLVDESHVIALTTDGMAILLCTNDIQSSVILNLQPTHRIQSVHVSRASLTRVPKSVVVCACDDRDQLLCYTIPSTAIGVDFNGIKNAAAYVFEGICLKYPSFVEFNSLNNAALVRGTRMDGTDAYTVWDLEPYMPEEKLCIVGKGITEIKFSHQFVLLYSGLWDAAQLAIAFSAALVPLPTTCIFQQTLQDVDFAMNAVVRANGYLQDCLTAKMYDLRSEFLKCQEVAAGTAPRGSLLAITIQPLQLSYPCESRHIVTTVIPAAPIQLLELFDGHILLKQKGQPLRVINVTTCEQHVIPQEQFSTPFAQVYQHCTGAVFSVYSDRVEYKPTIFDAAQVIGGLGASSLYHSLREKRQTGTTVHLSDGDEYLVAVGQLPPTDESDAAELLKPSLLVVYRSGETAFTSVLQLSTHLVGAYNCLDSVSVVAVQAHTGLPVTGNEYGYVTFWH